MGLHFSTEHYKAKPDPLLQYYVTAGDITPSSLGRSGRTERAQGGREEGGETGAHGRSSCTLSSLAASGGIQLFQNNHTRGGVLLEQKGWLTESGMKMKTTEVWVPL